MTEFENLKANTIDKFEAKEAAAFEQFCIDKLEEQMKTISEIQRKLKIEQDRLKTMDESLLRDWFYRSDLARDARNPYREYIGKV